MALRNQRGQTMVEYILLLAVSVSLILTFYRSDFYRRMFGSQGQLGRSIKSGNEFSYRHALGSKGGYLDPLRTSRDGSTHPSYHDGIKNTTRFFGPKVAYP